MKVLKFGGTSVGSSENIKKVIQIVSHASENQSVVVIVSAVGGITDKLINASRKPFQKIWITKAILINSKNNT